MVIGLQIGKLYKRGEGGGGNPSPQLYQILETPLNFELSFVGISDILREIWLFKYDFQARNFVQL